MPFDAEGNTAFLHGIEDRFKKVKVTMTEEARQDIKKQPLTKSDIKFICDGVAAKFDNKVSAACYIERVDDGRCKGYKIPGFFRAGEVSVSYKNYVIRIKPTILHLENIKDRQVGQNVFDYAGETPTV